MKTLGVFCETDCFVSGICWQLQSDVNGYVQHIGSELATQVSSARYFEVLNLPKEIDSSKELGRFKVRLWEDGYVCWFDIKKIIKNACLATPHKRKMLMSKFEIDQKLPLVIKWVEEAAKESNKYFWGGTIGPDFDCSGLVQTAFASQDIWLPRDAYQQEAFCDPLKIDTKNYQNLLPGDLLFFGTASRCNHVGIYVGQGFYFHSSGTSNGNDGIGLNGLHPSDLSSVGFYYRNQLRGAGRVTRCHDGTTLD